MNIPKFIEDLIEYTGDQLENCWDKDFKERTSDIADEQITEVDELIEFLSKLDIIKVDCVFEDLVEPRLEEMGREIEAIQGFTFKELKDSEDEERMKKSIKTVVPYLWRHRSEFYYIRKILKNITKIVVVYAIVKMIDPRVWYRYWSGFFRR
jgi:hypothetical protein